VIKHNECPKCGNLKHHESITIATTEGRENRKFLCKACGFTEHEFSGMQDEKTAIAVERMGDAFREYIKKRKLITAHN